MTSPYTLEDIKTKYLLLEGKIYDSFLEALIFVYSPFQVLKEEGLNGCYIRVEKRKSPADPNIKKWLRIKVYRMHDARKVLGEVVDPFSEIIVGYRSTRVGYRYEPIPYLDADASYIYLPFDEFVSLVWPHWKV